MSQVKRGGRIENRTSRNKLPAKREPYWLTLEKGRALGYRRGATGGTWIARLYLSGGKRDLTYKSLGAADDHADPDGVTVLNFSQAQAKAREWFAVAHALATGEEVFVGPYTVATAMRDYLKDCERRGLKRVDRMECATRLHILPELGGIEVSKLTRTRIEKWQDTLANSAPKVRVSKVSRPPIRRARKAIEGMKNMPKVPASTAEKRARKSSANRVLTILKAALNHAKARGRVATSGDAWRETKPYPNVDSARVRFLSIEEQVRLVNACPADFRRLVQAALFTGARYGELIRLCAHDFDTGSATVYISESKSGKPRHIYLTEEGRVFFQEAAAGLKGGDLLFTHEAFQDMRRVQPKTQEPVAMVQRPWKTSDQKRPMQAACLAGKIDPPISFHQLRHSYASSLIPMGIPLAYIAAQLGHSDTRMVEKHYGHLAPNAVAAAIRDMAPKLGIHQPQGVEALKLKAGPA